MKNIENNKKICIWMGYELIEGNVENDCEKHDYNVTEGHCTCGAKFDSFVGLGFVNDLKYDTSWDWLMPVVRKIHELQRRNDPSWYHVITTPIYFPIDLVYTTVTEFLKKEEKE